MKSVNKPKSKNPASLINLSSLIIDSVEETTCSIWSLPASIPRTSNWFSKTKFLKDYPDWEFLPNEDLNRKTIEIFLDLKTAKRFCSKDKKVIKVPNTNVFKIVSPILISRGISRIVSAENLIAL